MGCGAACARKGSDAASEPAACDEEDIILEVNPEEEVGEKQRAQDDEASLTDGDSDDDGIVAD